MHNRATRRLRLTKRRVDGNFGEYQIDLAFRKPMSRADPRSNQNRPVLLENRRRKEEAEPSFQHGIQNDRGRRV